MIRTIGWFVYFFGYLAAVSPHLRKAKKLERENAPELEEYMRKISSVWASRLLQKAGAEIHARGAEELPEGPVLFAANHQGNFDIPLILATSGRKTGFISKKEVRKLPLIGAWMDLLSCVFIDRKDRRQSLQAMKEGAEVLKRGSSLVVFPEGTRSRGGHMGEFKQGSFMLAKHVPVIPVLIENTYTLMEQNNGKITPGSVSITYGEPIKDHLEQPMKPKQLSELVEKRLRNMQEEAADYA
ncbi:lysophospholipid acyltransferase family protein [Alkalicoccus urumqiensis]|uniref:1-acyl-sn-glycerol-3-phosphate acyltransferase n=1 Tax=Alkalicoccus urumqiensis TaxID=1548213 RepID=A0A2P6MGM5_ALKUR|nr:lysophospholipid acyltransferase family protein [Alkalicoccus urumqiensis]PRO65423.1 1-acyl-sn-glycerol-3-phosphate acyltransferase [Alkalicoccus urumqiensis]